MDETIISSLHDAAAVDPVSPGLYRAHLSAMYNVVDHPNGGYLQCVLASAALAAGQDAGATHVDVTAISTNYMGAPHPGAVALRTTVRRVGRSVSFVHVEMAQDDQVVCEALATLGTLDFDPLIRYDGAELLDLLPLDECTKAPGIKSPNIMRVVDTRLDPRYTSWYEGERSEVGDTRGWMRLDDGGSRWDSWSLHLAVDVLPPATFPLGSSGWVPTLQLTSYARRQPVSEWLRVRQWCQVVADNLVDERVDIFDDLGLVASASQLAMVRFPTNLE